MPRKNPLNEREIQICRRLRQARQATNLSQVAFSRLLGIDSSRLASHEHARAPLRFGLARQAAHLSGVSVGWLASGEGPMNIRVLIERPTLDRIDENMLLSAAYDAILKPFFDPIIAQAKKNLPGSRPKIGLSEFWGEPTFVVGETSRKMVVDGIQLELGKLLDSVPPHLYADVCAEILMAFSQYRRLHQADLLAYAKDQPPKIDLTHTASRETMPDVKPKLPILLERLQKATMETGKMSALADYLDVPLASVSRWLSGKREPGGEITLRLLHWVEQQERAK